MHLHGYDVITGTPQAAKFLFTNVIKNMFLCASFFKILFNVAGSQAALMSL